MKRIAPFFLAACTFGAPAILNAEVGVSLKGSRSSMERQNQVARTEEYTFLRTATQVRRFVDDGYLVEMKGGMDYRVIAGYPFARPVVRDFVERLSADYRQACGERLVVTSLTRPTTKQPRNASPLSVHPAGMAVDLRVPTTGSCLRWLTKELLVLEDRGVIDATREYRPPHFHIAVFPAPYEAYEQTKVAQANAAEAERLLELAVKQREAEAFWASAAAMSEPVTEQAGVPLPLLFRLAVTVAALVLAV